MTAMHREISLLIYVPPSFMPPVTVTSIINWVPDLQPHSVGLTLGMGEFPDQDAAMDQQQVILGPGSIRAAWNHNKLILIIFKVTA